MNNLERKQQKHSVILCSYASGDGSISFVFQDRDGKASNSLKVSKRDVLEFLEIGKGRRFKFWNIFKNGPHYHLFQTVKRLNHDELEFNGKIYRYAKVHEQFFHILSDDGDEVKNLSIKAALMFFVNNEQAIDEQSLPS